jgi:hypothetical protein
VWIRSKEAFKSFTDFFEVLLTWLRVRDMREPPDPPDLSDIFEAEPTREF